MTASAAVTAHTSGHASTYRCGWVVLATGGFHSGAITLSSDWRASETVLGLPLHGMPAPDEPRFAADYFGPQPHVDGRRRGRRLVARAGEPRTCSSPAPRSRAR